MGKTTNKFSSEVRERAVRMMLDHQNDYPCRYTVERLMREMGFHGVIRGKPARTTISEKAARLLK